MKQVSSWNFQTVNDSGITLVNLPGGSTGNWTWYEVCCALWPNYIDLILIAISRSTITVHCSSSFVLCCCVHNRRTGIVLRHTCISLWVCGSYCLSHKMTLLTWNYNKTVDSPAEVKETQMQKSFLGSKSTTDKLICFEGRVCCCDSLCIFLPVHDYNWWACTIFRRNIFHSVRGSVTQNDPTYFKYRPKCSSTVHLRPCCLSQVKHSSFK